MSEYKREADIRVSAYMMQGRNREMYEDAVRWKVLLIILVVIGLGTAVGSSVGMVTHNAPLGFVTVVVFEGILFSLITLIYFRRQ